jgi:hypothetical protein
LAGTALKPLPPTDDVIRRIAMDVGKQVVEHIENMYPVMTDVVAWKSARRSIRNCVHNAIMAAVNAADEGRHEESLKANDKHRRFMRKIRKAKTLEDIIDARGE